MKKSMKKQMLFVYSLAVVTVGLLVCILVKLYSFDHRINRIGIMLTEQSLLNAPKEAREVAVGEGEGFAMGDTNAPVKVILFLDYECNYCKLFFANTFPEIEKQLIRTGKLRFVFRHFPIEMHPNAYLAAKMAEQARQQGKFYEMNDRLMKTDLLIYENLVLLAQELHIDTAAWLDNPASIERIQADKSAGERIRLRGTPAFIINGKMYTGMRNFEEFKELTDLNK